MMDKVYERIPIVKIMKSKKIKKISIIVLLVIFVMTLKIGCPGDFDGLLKYMFHEEFPEEYEVTKRSETTLFHYLLGERKCSYEVKLSESDHDILEDKIKSTGYWRVQHPEWSSNPCLYLNDKYCDKDELENVKKIKGAGLICYATFLPNNLTLLLSCYDI
jgi:hypothetical protein